MLQALLSEEESSINRKLRSATNSRQVHSDNEEHGSRAEHLDGPNVRAINVGVIDTMTDIARPGYITTHTNKVKSGGYGHDTIVVRLVVSTCVVTRVNGRRMSPGSVLAVLRNLIRRATSGTHCSGSNVMKTSSDSSDNCKRKLPINSKGHG